MNSYVEFGIRVVHQIHGKIQLKRIINIEQLVGHCRSKRVTG